MDLYDFVTLLNGKPLCIDAAITLKKAKELEAKQKGTIFACMPGVSFEIRPCVT